jgi:hypothetical protein
MKFYLTDTLSLQMEDGHPSYAKNYPPESERKLIEINSAQELINLIEAIPFFYKSDFAATGIMVYKLEDEQHYTIEVKNHRDYY